MLGRAEWAHATSNVEINFHSRTRQLRSESPVSMSVRAETHCVSLLTICCPSSLTFPDPSAKLQLQNGITLTSQPRPSSVMTSHTALMLHTFPPHAGSFPWIGSDTTPSPAKLTRADSSSKDVSSHKSNLLRSGQPKDRCAKPIGEGSRDKRTCTLRNSCRLLAFLSSALHSLKRVVRTPSNCITGKFRFSQRSHCTCSVHVTWAY